jgi:hypothetical protein
VGVACAAPATEPNPLAAAPPSVLVEAGRADRWPSDEQATAWRTQAGYRLQARTPGQFVAVRAPLAEVPETVEVVGRFRKVGGPPGGGYGLIVHDQGTSRGDGLDQGGRFVVVGVGDRGEVGVWRREATRWVDLLPWTPSSAVRAGGAPNELAVQTRASRLLFEVNGVRVADVETGLDGGRLGVFTGGDGNEVLLEQLTVQPEQPADRALDQDAPAVAAPAPAAAPGPAPAPAPVAAPAPQRDGADGSPLQRIQQLMVGIGEDIGAILQSLSSRPDAPHNPVSDPAALKEAENRLESATSKAHDLADELDKLQQAAHP